MRLTDTCKLIRTGQDYRRPSWPCEFGHHGGARDADLGHSYRYIETARAIVQADPELVALATPEGLELVHHGKTYRVTAILPRYRPGGRLHHVSLDLDAWTG